MMTLTISPWGLFTAGFIFGVLTSFVAMFVMAWFSSFERGGYRG